MSESYPPNGEQMPDEQSVPEASAPAAQPSQVPPLRSDLDAALEAAPPTKPKISWPFFVVGFLAPAAAAVLQGLIISGVSQLQAAAPLGILASVIQLAVVIGAIWAFVAGSRTGDIRLRSFGIGTFASFAVSTLVLLLAFGACIFSLGTGGNFFGG